MSLASWKAAFYPESAKAAAKRGELAAIEHSIRKWEGLTQENLAAHGLKQNFDEIGGPRTILPFLVNAGTCALCRSHPDGCDSCSLTLVRGVPCHVSKEGEEASPYVTYIHGWYSDPGDPQPMLRDLRSALDLVQITVHDGGPASDR